MASPTAAAAPTSSAPACRSASHATVIAVTVAAFVFSAVALAVSLATLGWEFAKWFFERGRVTVELVAGALWANKGLIHGPVKVIDEVWHRDLLKYGFVDPLVGVRVRNVGRAALTVDQWDLTHMSGISISGDDRLGPKVPKRLEVGESQMWFTDLATVLTVFASVPKNATATVDNVLYGHVQLGDGRTARSPQLLELPERPR